ncbi:Uncharacterised protein g6170 [Pycnogonum litorale]
MTEEHGLLTSSLEHSDSSDIPSRHILLEYGFSGTVCAMACFAFFCSIYSAATHASKGSATLILSIALIGFLVAAFLMVIYARNADFPTQKSWFLYMFGFVICVQSLFLSILIFNHNI